MKRDSAILETPSSKFFCLDDAILIGPFNEGDGKAGVAISWIYGEPYHFIHGIESFEMAKDVARALVYRVQSGVVVIKWSELLAECRELETEKRKNKEEETLPPLQTPEEMADRLIELTSSLV